MEKKHIIVATLIVALLAGVGWALWSGDDAEMVEAKQMQSEMLQKMESMSPDERRESRDNFRQMAQGLSEDQRRQLGEGFRRFFMQRMDQLLAMPREQQIQEIDQLIQRMEERRQSGGGGEGRPDRGRGGGSQAERDQRHKQMLDRTSPDQRAKMDKIKDLINDRREELGLEPMKGGRPPFGPPGGRPPR
ncbi:MAG: hypothetical protein AAGD11_17875 [Planctomycetota bacterium]